MSKVKTPITTLEAITEAVKNGKTVYHGSLYYEVKPKGDDYVIKCGNGSMIGLTGAGNKLNGDDFFTMEDE